MIGTATGATAGAIAGAWTGGACAAMGGSMAASGALRASDTGAGAGVAGTGAAAAGSDGAGVTTGAAAGVWAAGVCGRRGWRHGSRRRGRYRRRDRLCDGAMLRGSGRRNGGRDGRLGRRGGDRGRLSGVHGLRRRRGLNRRGGRRVFLKKRLNMGNKYIRIVGGQYRRTPLPCRTWNVAPHARPGARDAVQLAQSPVGRRVLRQAGAGPVRRQRRGWASRRPRAAWRMCRWSSATGRRRPRCGRCAVNFKGRHDTHPCATRCRSRERMDASR